MEAEVRETIFQDISRLFFAFLAVSVAYLSISLNMIETRINEQRKPVIDVILQLLSVPEPLPTESLPLTRFESRLFLNSVERTISRIPTNTLVSVEDAHDYGFDNKEIEGSKVFELASHRMPLPSCNVATVNLKRGETTGVLYTGVNSGYSIIDSDQINIVMFSECKIDRNDLHTLLFDTNEGRLFGLPKVFVDRFPELSSRPFLLQPFELDNDLREKIPSFIREHIKLKNKYFVFNQETLIYHFLTHAIQTTGNSYSFSEVDDAARALFRVEQKEATLLGVTSKMLFIVASAPAVFLFISWSLWRRVRELSQRVVSPESTNWFVFDAKTWLDKVLATALILFFFLMAIVVPYLFIVSLGAVLPLGSIAIGIDPWFKITTNYIHPSLYTAEGITLGFSTFIILLLNFIFCSKIALYFLWGVWLRKQ